MDFLLFSVSISLLAACSSTNAGGQRQVFCRIAGEGEYHNFRTAASAGAWYRVPAHAFGACAFWGACCKRHSSSRAIMLLLLQWPVKSLPTSATMRKLDMQSRGLQRLIYLAVLLALPSLGWADLPQVERFSFNAIFELTNSPEWLGAAASLERIRLI